MAKRVHKKKRPAGRAKLAALLVLLVLLAAVTVEVVNIYGHQLPDIQRRSDALEQAIQQTEQENEALRSDLEHAGDPDFIQDLARDELGLATDGERIFYDVNN